MPRCVVPVLPNGFFCDRVRSRVRCITLDLGCNNAVSLTSRQGHDWVRDLRLVAYSASAVQGARTIDVEQDSDSNMRDVGSSRRRQNIHPRSRREMRCELDARSVAERQSD
jgi:hypothetical protein